jgi:hypothetical protein
MMTKHSHQPKLNLVEIYLSFLFSYNVSLRLPKWAQVRQLANDDDSFGLIGMFFPLIFFSFTNKQTFTFLVSYLVTGTRAPVTATTLPCLNAGTAWMTRRNDRERRGEGKPTKKGPKRCEISWPLVSFYLLSFLIS